MKGSIEPSLTGAINARGFAAFRAERLCLSGAFFIDRGYASVEGIA
jgi:hypothetical protein